MLLPLVLHYRPIHSCFNLIKKYNPVPYRKADSPSPRVGYSNEDYFSMFLLLHLLVIISSYHRSVKPPNIIRVSHLQAMFITFESFTCSR